MKRIGSLTLAALLGVAVWYAGPRWRAIQQQAFAQEIQSLPDSEGSYLLSYFDVSTSFDKSEGGYGGPGHSGGAGDALLRIVNAGNYEAVSPPWLETDPLPVLVGTGDLCAYIFVFNDVQEMQECCQCDLSADSLRTLSVINDLTSNPLIAAESTEAGVIKIIGVAPLYYAGVTGCLQFNQTGFAVDNLADAEGLHAWINHTESMASNQAGFTPPFGFITSTSVDEFAPSRLDTGEFESLFTQCEFINLHGSGHGICKCGFGD